MPQFITVMNVMRDGKTVAIAIIVTQFTMKQMNMEMVKNGYNAHFVKHGYNILLFYFYFYCSYKY